MEGSKAAPQSSVDAVCSLAYNQSLTKTHKHHRKDWFSHNPAKLRSFFLNLRARFRTAQVQ